MHCCFFFLSLTLFFFVSDAILLLAFFSASLFVEFCLQSRCFFFYLFFFMGESSTGVSHYIGFSSFYPYLCSDNFSLIYWIGEILHLVAENSVAWHSNKRDWNWSFFFIIVIVVCIQEFVQIFFVLSFIFFLSFQFFLHGLFDFVSGYYCV